MIPRRRKSIKMRPDWKDLTVFPRHERWVRGFECSVPGCCTGARIEFCHIRNAANSGTSIKPHSAFGYPLCAICHREEHGGEETFWAKHKINPYAKAAWFLKHSPDTAMRDSFHELPAHVQRPLLEAA